MENCNHCYCRYTTGMLLECCKCGKVMMPSNSFITFPPFSWPPTNTLNYEPWQDPIYRANFMYHEGVPS